MKKSSSVFLPSFFFFFLCFGKRGLGNSIYVVKKFYLQSERKIIIIIIKNQRTKFRLISIWSNILKICKNN
jgi:hypothetical protein